MDQNTLAMAQEIDFSLLALFMRATFIVKLVMIMLIVASFWSWSIIVQKFIAFRKARAEAEAFDQAFWSGEPLDELYDQLQGNPVSAPERVFAAGMTEWRRSHKADGALIAGEQ
jgi:biopolymer transport protein TolQ